MQQVHVHLCLIGRLTFGSFLIGSANSSVEDKFETTQFPSSNAILSASNNSVNIHQDIKIVCILQNTYFKAINKFFNNNFSA